MESTNKPSLGSCLIMDGIGMATYILPVFGETLDFVWAFISAFIFHSWFKSSAGAIGSFCEEILPFTDIVPSFTIGHFLTDGE